MCHQKYQIVMFKCFMFDIIAYKEKTQQYFCTVIAVFTFLVFHGCRAALESLKSYHIFIDKSVTSTLCPFFIFKYKIIKKRLFLSSAAHV